jgi:hypothetical protein
MNLNLKFKLTFFFLYNPHVAVFPKLIALDESAQALLSTGIFSY